MEFIFLLTVCKLFSISNHKNVCVQCLTISQGKILLFILNNTYFQFISVVIFCELFILVILYPIGIIL